MSGGFLAAVLLAVLLGAGFALPAAFFLLKRDKPADDLAAGATTPTDTGRGPDSSPVRPPAATEKRDLPGDTARGGPVPAAPVVWKDFTSRDGRFSVRFPGAPAVTSPPNARGRRVQMFTAALPPTPERMETWFAVTCEDFDPGETSDADAFLAAHAAEPGPQWTKNAPIKLGRFPGLELHRAAVDVHPKVVRAGTRRLYLVHTRLYTLTATGPPGPDAPPLFQEFFDSFKLLDSSEPELLPSPIVVAVPPKDGLAGLQLNVPDGWTANYNKFSFTWTLTKPAPTPRSNGEEFVIEECPADARTPEVYAARLKERDFLTGDVPGFVEVGNKGNLPDGFYFKGVVKKYPNGRTPPILGLAAVRDIGGLKVRCYSANLRTTKERPEGLREELLEMFKAAKFAAEP